MRTQQRAFCGWILGLMCLAGDLWADPRRPIRSAEPGWPQFRGPHRDGISDERGLLQTWPENGPAQLWSITNLGRGYSSPIISNGKLVITGDRNEQVVIECFDLEGKPLWQATNGPSWKDPYPGARSSVTFSDGHVYHQNAHGRVTCQNAENGREVWAMDTFAQYGATNLTWGHAECLLVDDKAVYVTAGGRKALFVALNKRTGAQLWMTPALKDRRSEDGFESASYASPILVHQGSRKVLIGCSLRHLFAVDAETGALLWTAPMPTAYSVLASMPVLVGDGVFMTAPHGKGGILWRMDDTGKAVTETWRNPLDPCQGGIIHVEGRLYGSYYSGRKGWAAVDAKTGKTLFEKDDLYKGQALYADHRLYALCEDGWMTLLEPTDKEFAVRGKLRFAEARQRDAWAHPVVLNKRLYLRFHERLACFDIAAKN